MVHTTLKRRLGICIAVFLCSLLYLKGTVWDKSVVQTKVTYVTKIEKSNENLDIKMRKLKSKMDKSIGLPYNVHKQSFRREKQFLQESSIHVFPPPEVLSPYAKILPSVSDPVNDRIYEQLHHVPKSYLNKTEGQKKLKTIYLHGGQNQWFIQPGRDFFLTTGCKVNHCSFTYSRKEGQTADVVVFGNPYQLPFRPPWPRASQEQIWMMSALETPPHTMSMKRYAGYFNWTMSYRTDSIIVSPYFKYEAFSKKKDLPYKNHAQGKKKKVAWFVSNCFNVESGRREYAKELQKYINVDIYGGCGKMKCRKSEWEKCRQMVQRDYKFYLAFENSKCKDYLTEKVQTGLL